MLRRNGCQRNRNAVIWSCLGLAGLLTAPLVSDGQQVVEAQAEKVRIAFHAPDSKHPTGSVTISPLPPTIVQTLRSRPRSLDGWQRLLTVSVVQSGRNDLPPVLGSYRVQAAAVQFQPRFALQPGLRYRVVFHPERLSAVKAKRIVHDFTIPAPKPGPATQITHVFPTSNRLPENQLKFYIHFSSPMSRGEAYRHIRLLDARGQAVDHPFLELAEELWDYSGTRFTLFFDPGRIKRGLKPRELFGPALKEGQSYTLVISNKWRDARGQTLQSPLHKKFRVTAPDDKQPHPGRWKLKTPSAGTREPLTVVFDEPLDHAMLERVLHIQTGPGGNVDGEIAIGPGETQWSFAPRQAWQPGIYELLIDTALEDRAGNSIARPFEVDRLRRVERRIKTRTVTRSFVIPPS